MFGRRADRHAVLALGVTGNAIAYFPGQVQPVAIVLEHVDNAQALFVVVETARHERTEDPFAGMAKRRVPQVVPKRNRLGQLLVQLQHLRDGSGDLCHFEGVRQAGAIVIAGR